MEHVFVTSVYETFASSYTLESVHRELGTAIDDAVSFARQECSRESESLDLDENDWRIDVSKDIDGDHCRIEVYVETLHLMSIYIVKREVK